MVAQRRRFDGGPPVLRRAFVPWRQLQVAGQRLRRGFGPRRARHALCRHQHLGQPLGDLPGGKARLGLQGLQRGQAMAAMVPAQAVQIGQGHRGRGLQQALALAGRAQAVGIEQRRVQQHQQHHHQPGHGRIQALHALQPGTLPAAHRHHGIAHGIQQQHRSHDHRPDALVRPAVLLHTQTDGPQGQPRQHRHGHQGSTDQGPHWRGIGFLARRAVLVDGVHKQQHPQPHAHQQRRGLARLPQTLHPRERQEQHEQHHHQ